MGEAEKVSKNLPCSAENRRASEQLRKIKFDHNLLCGREKSCNEHRQCKVGAEGQ